MKTELCRLAAADGGEGVTLTLLVDGEKEKFTISADDYIELSLTRGEIEEATADELRARAAAPARTEKASNIQRRKKTMTRRERVKTALAHKTPDRLPSCIHLAGDGQSAYFDRLYEQYASPEIKKLHESGVLSYSHAIYYGIGNCVLALGCPWWGWTNMPKEYSEEDSPGFLPPTVGSVPTFVTAG